MDSEPKKNDATADKEDGKCLYIFLDEGGNLDFSSKGTSYFTLTAITKNRPFVIESDLLSLKYDLIEAGTGIEYFHASEDRQAVRDQVFNAITNNIKKVSINSIIVEKQKMSTAFQQVEQLYPLILACLLEYIAKGIKLKEQDKLIVITDTLPLKSKRKAIEKGIKITLKKMLSEHAKYKILHHSSKSAIGLQIADYCNWAIFRQWERNDPRSYDLIKPAIEKEYQVSRSHDNVILIKNPDIKPKHPRKK